MCEALMVGRRVATVVRVIKSKKEQSYNRLINQERKRNTKHNIICTVDKITCTATQQDAIVGAERARRTFPVSSTIFSAGGVTRGFKEYGVLNYFTFSAV